MALTYIPEDTDDLDLKTQRDVRCGECGTRRTVDGYNEPTVATCIDGDCGAYFVIPAYPFQNEDITFTKTEQEARDEYEQMN